MKCMHMISRNRDHSEGWGSTAVWNLSENSSDLVAWPLVWLLEPSSKCVLFWFFSIQLLKKYTLNPEITLLYQFRAQKAVFKVPKGSPYLYSNAIWHKWKRNCPHCVVIIFLCWTCCSTRWVRGYFGKAACKVCERQTNQHDKSEKSGVWWLWKDGWVLEWSACHSRVHFPSALSTDSGG